MRLLLAAIIICAVTAGAYAAETERSRPLINTTADELVNISEAQLKSSENITMDVNVTNVTGGYVTIPASAFLQQFFAKPARWLANGAYTYSVLVSDWYGNNATGAYPFLVNVSGQDITLLVPQYGGTNDSNTSFVIQSEFSSACRWLPADREIMDENEFMAIMRPFNESDGRRHTLLQFFNASGVSPQEDLEVTVSVTCNDTDRFTSKLFYITYITEAPAISVHSAPNPIVDPADPTTEVSVTADQEVWCTGDGQPWFGARTIDNYRTSHIGVYRDPVFIDKQRNLSITCVNRIGKEVSRNHTQLFNYTSITEIEVTSAAVTANVSHQIRFSTSKSSTCTVTKGNAGWAVTPQTYAKSFATSTSNPRLTEGDNQFTINCDTGYQPEPTAAQHTVMLDSTRPLVDIIARPNSCGLERVTFDINATDPAPSSGISHYNYTLFEKVSGEVLVEWTTTTQDDISVRNIDLVNGTEYAIRGIAFDRAGNPSTTDEVLFKATDGTELSCDDEDPDAIIYTKKVNETIHAYLICVDNNGCSDNSYCNVVAGLDKSCSVDTTSSSQRYVNGTSILIPSSSTVCCQVSDLSGNTGNARKNVVVSNNTQPPQPPGNCENEEKDGDETDVDCGGFYCTSLGKACPPGGGCTSGVHCESGICIAGSCAAPSCIDGVKNGAEAGVDCGPSCGTTCGTYNLCSVDGDCGVDERCERQTCIPGDELTGTGNLPGSEEPEDSGYEEPGVIEDAFNLLNIILIVAGLLCMLGGGSYILLYKEPKKEQRQAPQPPRRTFEEEPLVIAKPILQQTEEAIHAKRRSVVKERVQEAISEFGTPEELHTKKNITHKDLEKAYDVFDADVFRDTTKKLLAEKKVEKHHVAIALTDIAAKKDVDKDAIESLRKEFRIKEGQ